MYPDRDALSNVALSGYITACDQSMVESGVTEGGKTLPVFFFVNELNNLTTNTKPQAKKQRFLKSSQKINSSYRRKKHADNIRKVLCESFIQWF